jgi:phosphohistidine phosphatase
MRADKFIVLVRHGIAEDKGTKADADRELTDAGVEKMKEIAMALARIVPDADTIYSSPLVRAKQTAELVARAFDPPLAITETEALTPRARIAAFRELLSHAGGETIICVGHEPNLSMILNELTGMPPDSVNLKKGGSYALRMTGPDAQLEWMLAPRILLTLRGGHPPQG